MADTHLERLLVELGARAQAEIAQVEADAVARAHTIRAASTARGEARKAEAIAALDVEFAQRRNSAIADARRRARRVVLCAQHGMVDRVLARIRRLAVERLAEPASECGVARRSALLRSYAVTSNAVIERLEDGIRLQADGGHLSIDDTVDAWLAADRAAIAIDACRSVEDAPC